MENLNRNNNIKKDRRNSVEDKGIVFENHLRNLKSQNITEDSTFVVLFCPKLQICTLIKDYNKADIIGLLSLYQKDNYLIVHINNDDTLYHIVLESKFSSSILSDLSKITDITIDYCFSPVDELLFFNFSLLKSCDLYDYNKFTTQMYFVHNGLFIVNKKGFLHIFEIMMTKFHFELIDKESFFENLTKLGNKNQMALAKEKSNEVRRSSSCTNVIPLTGFDSDYRKLLKRETFCKLKIKKDKQFFADKFIYWLMVVSLEKLEDFSDQVTKELSNLYELYLKLPLKERKAFYKRLHSTETAIEMIHGETKMKKKFINFILAHGTLYNKLTDNYFYKNNFDLLLDLIMSKITQLEFCFERYESTITLIKDNFHVIIEDNENQGTITFNNTMKLLTIITTLYAPLNILTGIMSMNVQVPFQAVLYQNFNTFFVIVFLVIIIDWILIYIFKRFKWF